jgi:hypothetical protein
LISKLTVAAVYDRRGCLRSHILGGNRPPLQFESS